MLLSNLQRQHAIAIARGRDEDESEQAARQAEDDSIIDTALLALILQAIQEDLDERDEEAREARRLHTQLFHALKKQCIRINIQIPEASPWKHFEGNSNGSDQSWFHYVGLSKESFSALVELCEEPWRNNPIIDFNGKSHPQGKPRPCALAKRLLDCRATIALGLRYLMTPDSRDSLAMMFGVVESCVNKYIAFALSILLHILERDP
jgi:hypothetical protein